MHEGLTMRLSPQSGWEVCGEVASDEEGMALIGQIKPDLALIDISLKSGNGIDLVKRIKSRHPLVNMLVISGIEESLYCERALRVGAMGYLNKQVSNENLLESVRTVQSGKRFISDALAQRLFGQAVGDVERANTSIERLSDRELEVYRMIGQGLYRHHRRETLHQPVHHRRSPQNVKRKLALANELTHTAVQWVLENS